MICCRNHSLDVSPVEKLDLDGDDDDGDNDDATNDADDVDDDANDDAGADDDDTGEMKTMTIKITISFRARS